MHFPSFTIQYFWVARHKIQIRGGANGEEIASNTNIFHKNKTLFIVSVKQA